MSKSESDNRTAMEFWYDQQEDVDRGEIAEVTGQGGDGPVETTSVDVSPDEASDTGPTETDAVRDAVALNPEAVQNRERALPDVDDIDISEASAAERRVAKLVDRKQDQMEQRREGSSGPTPSPDSDDADSGPSQTASETGQDSASQNEQQDASEKQADVTVTRSQQPGAGGMMPEMARTPMSEGTGSEGFMGLGVSRSTALAGVGVVAAGLWAYYSDVP